ncbi:hypothetical protein D3C76_1133600 [compost metagenome]
MGARRVFAHQQQGVRVEQRHHHDGASVATAHPLVDPLLAVGEFQMQGLHLEQAALGHDLGAEDDGFALVLIHHLGFESLGFALVMIHRRALIAG